MLNKTYVKDKVWNDRVLMFSVSGAIYVHILSEDLNLKQIYTFAYLRIKNAYKEMYIRLNNYYYYLHSEK